MTYQLARGVHYILTEPRVVTNAINLFSENVRPIAMVIIKTCQLACFVNCYNFLEILLLLQN